MGISGQRKREQVQDSKEKLIELRGLLAEYHSWDKTDVEENVFWTAKSRYELLRETQQEIENFLFGAEPEWPWRAPVIRSLEFEDEEHGSDSACAAGRSGVHTSAIENDDVELTEVNVSLDLNVGEDSVVFTEDEDSALLSGGILDRTLPMLDIAEAVQIENISASAVELESRSTTLTVVNGAMLVDIEPGTDTVGNGDRDAVSSRKKRRLSEL